MNIGLDKPNKNYSKVLEAIKKTVDTAKRYEKYAMIMGGLSLVRRSKEIY